MKIIYESKFIKLEFDEEKKILKSFWKKGNNNISEKQIKNEITKSTGLIIEYKPNFIITDDRSRTFLYSVEIQDWVSKMLFGACIEAEIEKFAVLLPKELVAEISTEQVADEVTNRPYQLNMFSDEEKALKWIAEQ